MVEAFGVDADQVGLSEFEILGFLSPTRSEEVGKILSGEGSGDESAVELGAKGFTEGAEDGDSRLIDFGGGGADVGFFPEPGLEDDSGDSGLRRSAFEGALGRDDGETAELAAKPGEESGRRRNEMRNLGAT